MDKDTMNTLLILLGVGVAVYFLSQSIVPKIPQGYAQEDLRLLQEGISQFSAAE